MSGILPQKYKFTGVPARIKNWDKEDIGMIVSEVPAVAAGLFTTNKYVAAPVEICCRHLGNPIHGILVNSGVANACTGAQGMIDAEKCLAAAASLTQTSESGWLVGSTGVIGAHLPVEKMCDSISKMQPNADDDSAKAFSRSMMTTDTFPKMVCKSLLINGNEIRLLGFAKGAGMIQPNMATMLSFVVTDAEIEQKVLQQMLQDGTQTSFNCISVDGDMSTNDTVLCLANGSAGSIEGSENEFAQALTEVLQELAQLIVRDGEGATKFITIDVCNTPDQKMAKEIAMKVANSNLVKTAFFGEDANWGRIMCAVGSHQGAFDPNLIELRIGETVLFNNGVPVPFDEEIIKNYLHQTDLNVVIDMKQGTECARIWTCDLSYDYVKINADYRT